MRYWLPPILWSAVILLASSDPFSAAHTGSLLEALVRWIVSRPLSPEHFAMLHAVVRKAGHLIAYGILGGLYFRAVRGNQQGWSWRWALAAVAMAASVASLDEWHQTFVPSRTGSPVDVAIDTIGATLAQLVMRIADRGSRVAGSG